MLAKLFSSLDACSLRRVVLRAIGGLALVASVMVAEAQEPAAVTKPTTEEVADDQPVIWLRDLSRIVPTKVIDASVAGLAIETVGSREGSAPTRITWDEVDDIRLPAGMISDELQAKIDDLQSTLSLPLYQVKHRLRVGDEAGALAAATSLESVFESAPSPSAYVVKQSLMWGYLAEGRREEAMLAYLSCLDLLSKRAAKITDVAGPRRLAVDPRSGVCRELLPISLDQQAAQKVIESLEVRMASLAAPIHPGTYLYAAAIAQSAGDTARRDAWLKQFTIAEVPTSYWPLLIVPEGAALTTDWLATDDALAALPPSLQSLARYRRGQLRLKSAEMTTVADGAIDLVWAAATELPGDDRGLAADGLRLAADHLAEAGDTRAANAIRAERSKRYGAIVSRETPKK